MPGCLVGAKGWVRLKVLDGPGAALDISRKSTYTEVVRQHSWLLSAKWGKLERLPGSRESWGSLEGGPSAGLCEHGAGAPPGDSSWVRSNVDGLQVRPVNIHRLCPISLQKRLWGCQFRIGHCFKINKGARAIIYL